MVGVWVTKLVMLTPLETGLSVSSMGRERRGVNEVRTLEFKSVGSTWKSGNGGDVRGNSWGRGEVRDPSDLRYLVMRLVKTVSEAVEMEQ